MLKNPSFIISVLLLSLYGCVEKYFPDEEELQTGTLVVVAELNNLPGRQSIFLSRSASLQQIKRDPVSNCFVQVERDDGATREFIESQPGEYGSYLDDEFLITGREYRLRFFSQEGDQYESEFEQLHPPSDIHSVYYMKEDHPTKDPSVIEEGIQFYIDFEIEKDSGRYLRWQLNEIYELHNPDYESRKYGVDRRWSDLLASDKWLTCWISQDIPEIITLDLGNVDGSVYRKMPLNFVSGQTKKLQVRYSLLVRQLALSEKSFWYWNELGKNVQSKDGLFVTQPSLTPGNICNVDKEDELVIGYFSISGTSETRIFVDKVPGMDVFEDPYYCSPGLFPMYLWRYPSEKLPLYVARASINGVTKNGEIKDECVDCRLKKGSTNFKPDFW